jgi:DNA-binding MarR family transcriptional regulator/tetratricopeptide (TPR) repeat protein
MAGQSYLPIEVLDYIDTHAPPPDSPYGISQRELAKALGYHPCSMSRPLDDLVRDGLLSSKRGPVRDGIRKQLVYRLTEAGRGRLTRETRHVPLLSGALPPPPNPFLGRREELTQLGEFATVGGSIMLVDGQPGMGKTALVSRHMRRVKRDRIPFWFTVRPSASSRQFVSALSHALSALGAPQLAYYSQLPRAPQPREVADLTSRALGEQGLAVVVDDFQMAGPDLRSFLEKFFAELVRGQKDQVYIIGQELPELSTIGAPVRRLTVGGLDRSAAHELTDRKGGLAERFERVFTSTLGSPLLLQLAVSNPEVEADAANLPARVVDRLTMEEVRAMLPIALSTEPLPVAFVTDSGALSSSQLAEVIRMGIVQKSRQGRLEILQVVRGAMLSRVTSTDERAAHMVLADFYAGSHRPESIRERFLHLVEAESWKVASQLLTQQDRTLLGLGYSEALRSALRHLAAALPRGLPKVRVLQAEASLLRHHSDYADSITVLQRAIVESNDEPKITCEAQLAIVELRIRLRQVDAAEHEYAEAQKIGPITRRLQAYFLLSQARLLDARGEGRQSLARYQEAYEMARRFKIADLALESIAAWSRLEDLESGPEVSLRVAAEGLPEARQAGRVDIAFNLRLVRARAYFRLGQVSTAESEMKLVRSEAEALGYLNQLCYALDGLISVASESGRLKEAASYAKQSCALAERLGNDVVLGHSLAQLCSVEGRLAADTGNAELLQDSIEHGKRGLEVLGRLPPSEVLVFAHGYLAEVYLLAADLTKASVSYKMALELSEKLGLGWVRDIIATEFGGKLEQAIAAARTEGPGPP